MNTLRQGWSDGLAANDEEAFQVERFVDEDWDDESAGPSFSVTGAPPSMLRMPQSGRVVTMAHGIVKRVLEDRLILGTPGRSSGEVVVGYRLSASVDLRPLIGRRVRLTLEDEPSQGRLPSQTLTIRTHDDHVWLVVRCGCPRDESHDLSGEAVHVTMSPNAGGPMVIALPDLQHIVAAGGEKRIRIGASRYVVELVWHDQWGGANYFIADDRLWH